MGRTAYRWGLVCLAPIWFAIAGAASLQVDRGATVPLAERRSIQYAAGTPADRIARLNRALSEGATSLRPDARTGYLRPLLDVLDISVESQLLVFSKTGIQRAYTSPRNPRTLFFDESVAVSYLPGSPSIEVASHDPQLGVVFYTLDQASAPALLVRRTSCLTCHVSDGTLGVPGMIVNSNMVADDGTVMPQREGHPVNHTTPHADRWGGWFVTSGPAPAPYSRSEHLGNTTFSAPGHPSDRVFLDWINGSPETRGYLSASSDIAALLTFDHQMHAINLLTRLNWEARIAADANRPIEADAPVRRLANELADYLLFVGEARFSVPLTARPAFAAWMTSRFPQDRRGRSLAQLDLITRLLRYPCSYLIYSEAFDALPEPVKSAVYARMLDVIGGRAKGAPYEHPLDDRRAVLEILADTKKDFPLHN